MNFRLPNLPEPRAWLVAGWLVAATAGQSAAPTLPVDQLIFGDPASEQQHNVAAPQSETLTGGLGEPARRLLPPATNYWEGGRVSFTLNVDPARTNYLTVRLWGSDASRDLLILFCEGKQVGYRHLGDIDLLDTGSDAPEFNGRFLYKTTPLPFPATRGQSRLRLEIRSTGPIWGYGTSFAQYQQPMKQPTRGLYRLYTHTDGCFVPPADEKQGAAPADPPVRSEPGVEVLADVKARLIRELNNLLQSPRPRNQMQMHLLARAYFVKWSPACQNPKAVEQIVRSMDALFAAHRKNPKLVEGDPSTPNPEWFAFSLAADAVRLLAQPLAPVLDQMVADGAGQKLSRRAAWAEMFLASREWLRRHRRSYTNQSMIIDLNLYRANRALAALDPARALPEPEALHYLYESIGLQPWLGSDTAAGPAKPLGDDYWQLTARGLTKELGFVGSYGEVIDWVTQIYDATREPGQPGDARIKAQLVKIAQARAVFRHPMLDAEGFRALRAETVVGWRDVHFPGDVTYGQRHTWDASALSMAATTRDPRSLAYAQQMLEDHQFFGPLKEHLRDSGLRVTAGLLDVPEDYDTIQSLPRPGATRLPMTPGQPDFVFSDEEDGVIAVKHGEEILYASLYWRARFGVNGLARVHHLLPRYSRVAVVGEETRFDPSGLTTKRADWINFGFANGGHRYPGDLHSALAGEELPIAKVPEGIPFKPGQENAHAGKGTFYVLRYGDYLIAMNTTRDRTFDLKVPADARPATNLVSGGAPVPPGATVRVTPRSTLVLYSGK